MESGKIPLGRWLVEDNVEGDVHILQGLHILTQAQTRVCISKCASNGARDAKKEKQDRFHRRAQTLLLCPGPVLQMGLLCREDIPMNSQYKGSLLATRRPLSESPQVTGSLSANLDMSMELFHKVFLEAQVISRNPLEIQRKHCEDKGSVKNHT